MSDASSPPLQHESPPPPPRRRGRPSRSERHTPLALIDAAERLFGAHGVEGVSLRRINNEAEVLNKSAISYHFGNKPSLIEAIWKYRLPILERKRVSMIAESEANGTKDDLPTQVAILLRPLFDIVGPDGRHSYCAFFYQAMRSALGRELRQRMMAHSPSSEAMMNQLRSGLGLPHDVLVSRMHIATQAFIAMILDRDDALLRHEPVEETDVFLADALAMVTVMVSRPWPVASLREGRAA